MPDFLYPDVSVQVLKMIEVMRLSYLEAPTYFEDAPYPREVEQFFRSWFQTPITEDTVNMGQTARELVSDDRHEALYIETVALYGQLKAAKPANADASEAMAYFRTITQLQERLLAYQERALGIKQLHEFHSVVMDIMENTLTEEQREVAMGRLKDAIKAK